MKYISTAFLFVITLTILGCSRDSLVPVRGPESDPNQQLNFSEFNDFPIPINSKLVKDQSIIIAMKDGWLGRLTLQQVYLKSLYMIFSETNSRSLAGRKYQKLVQKVVF